MPLTRIFHIFERNIEPFHPSSGSVHVRWHKDTDLEIMLQHRPNRDYITTRLAKGARIAVAEYDGVIAGWRYYQPGAVSQSPCFRLQLRDDAIAAFAAFVIPAFRGRRIFSAIHDHCAVVLANEGYRRMISMTSGTNRASLSAHSHAGEHPIMRVTLRKALGWTLVSIDGKHRIGRWSKTNRLDIHVP